LWLVAEEQLTITVVVAVQEVLFLDLRLLLHQVLQYL
jgi:hypothetical protein